MVIVLLIGISVLVAGVFLFVFFWSMKNGQFDDTYTPSVRMLFDDNFRPDKDGQQNKHEPQQL